MRNKTRGQRGEDGYENESVAVIDWIGRENEDAREGSMDGLTHAACVSRCCLLDLTPKSFKLAESAESSLQGQMFISLW